MSLPAASRDTQASGAPEDDNPTETPTGLAVAAPGSAHSPRAGVPTPIDVPAPAAPTPLPSTSAPPPDATIRGRIVSALSFLSRDTDESDDGYDDALAHSGSSGSSASLHRAAIRNAGRWEADQDVDACHKCKRRFTFFLRKHHCRRCGRIFCDACTSHRAHLDAGDLVIDPAMPEMLGIERIGPSRVCDWCTNTYGLGQEGDTSLLSNMMGLVARPPPLDVALAASSHSSLLEECPVCDFALQMLATPEEREAHVMHCLEHGAPADAAPRTRYVASRLGADSILIGTECIICMEEFVINDLVARLSCLCCFHKVCIDTWLEKSHGCPTHASNT